MAGLMDFMLEQRGWFVIPIVLPLSLVYDLWFKIRAWAIQKFYSAPELHKQKVEAISQKILEWKQSGETTKLCTARGGWQSISPGYRGYKKNCTQIPVNLYDITAFDEKARTVKAEPYVNMGMLSHFLIPRGYTIPVLPEMDDLTVGGLYMGVGIECTSHKYGLFNDIVVEAEIVLASGEVVTCSKTERRDLFDALPWSYGTLGFLTSVTLQVIPCQPYVRLEYIPCRTKEDSEREFRAAAEADNPPEWVEGISFSEDEMVVMKGEFCKEEAAPSSQRNAIGWWFKPWFYKHVETKLAPKLPAEAFVEYIPLRDYYHRHTKSIFWELDQILQPFDGNHPVFRYLLGWMIPPKVSFLKLTTTGSLKTMYEEQHVIQDMLVPLSKMKEALDVFKDKYDLYPLWICPYRAYSYSDGKEPHRCFLREPKELAKADKQTGLKYEMYVDLGAYGVPRACLEKRPFDIVTVSREVESYVKQVHGFQMLYADSYLTRDEFRQMFDHTHYEAMKDKYDPGRAFPEVYDKVSKSSIAKAFLEKRKNADAAKSDGSLKGA
jgi:delta24-sterol reductase